MGLTIYVRYRQIIHVMDHHEVLKDIIGNLNKRSLYVGLASCYGISIVANFQETNVSRACVALTFFEMKLNF